MPPDSFLEEFLGLTRPTGNHREIHRNTHPDNTRPACSLPSAPPRLAVAKAEFDAMLPNGTARRAEGCGVRPPSHAQE